MKWDFYLEHTGFCTSYKSEALRGAKRESIRFYATFGIFNHPLHGLVLFDVGYHPNFFIETKKWPFNLYARITPVYHNNYETASNRLKSRGFDPMDVKHIVISHFHADHIAGLKDFSNAIFHCSEEAWQGVKGATGFKALRQGFIPNLLPEDFESRLNLVRFSEGESTITDSILGPQFDLFGDRSFLLCLLPGHAVGQIGARVKMKYSEVFMIADAAWLKENFENLHLPSPIVKLFFSSWSDFKASLKRVHDFNIANPEVPIIPCHCRTTMESWQNLQNEL